MRGRGVHDGSPIAVRNAELYQVSNIFLCEGLEEMNTWHPKSMEGRMDDSIVFIRWGERAPHLLPEIALRMLIRFRMEFFFLKSDD